MIQCYHGFQTGLDEKSTFMSEIQIEKIGITEKRIAATLSILVLAFVILTLIQDFLRSDLNNSTFYFSESFMFSSFWWLFAPLLFSQYLAVRNKNKIRLAYKASIIILPVFIHLIAFPIIVWLLSSVFYYHTFSFQQTLRYTLSEHLYLIVLLYTIPVITFHFFTKKIKVVKVASATEVENITNQFVKAFIVSDGNKKQPIAVSEIAYFTANPPYINIHLEGKRFLKNQTLKSVILQLDPEQFIRVHKSTIVNIKMVVSYTTRLNGDYDIMMKNKTQLRVSRNFAAAFKSVFNQTHHLATE